MFFAGAFLDGLRSQSWSRKSVKRGPPVAFTEDFKIPVGTREVYFDHRSLQRWVDETSATLLPMLGTREENKTLVLEEPGKKERNFMRLKWVPVPLHDLRTCDAHCAKGGYWGADGPISLPWLGTGWDTWMSLSPMEVYTLRGSHRLCRGKVCIGGLGIGYSLERVLQRKAVEHVTVVDTCAPLVELLKPGFERRYPGRVSFVVSDVWKHLSKDGKPSSLDYDTCFIDIWPGYAGNKKDTDYLRLKRACENAPKSVRCLAWGT